MADPCVLITGANGFIGSYTALLFESLERKIVPLDVAPRGRVPFMLRPFGFTQDRQAQHERKYFNVFKPSSVHLEPVER